MRVFVLCPHYFYPNPKGFSSVFRLIRQFFFTQLEYEKEATYYERQKATAEETKREKVTLLKQSRQMTKKCFYSFSIAKPTR